MAKLTARGFQEVQLELLEEQLTVKMGSQIEAFQLISSKLCFRSSLTHGKMNPFPYFWSGEKNLLKGIDSIKKQSRRNCLKMIECVIKKIGGE